MKQSFLFLAAGLGQLYACLGNEVALPVLTLQIRANAQVRAGSFLSDVLLATDEFIESYFMEYLSKTGNAYSSLEDVNLRVVGYDTTGDYYQDKEETATVVLEGDAVFGNASNSPSDGIMANLARSAFQGSSRFEFVDLLLASPDTFLAAMDTLVASVDGEVVAEMSISSGSQGSSSDVTSTTMVIVIVVSVGFLFLAAALGMCAVCIRRGKMRGVPQLPTTSNKPGRKKKSFDDLEIQPTRSPSPVHSIASQDSSKFTFNPRNAGSIESRSLESKSLPSQFSAIQVDVSQTMDVEAWRNSTISPITPAPFGHDISAIEDRKDLSLIEEVSDEDVTPISKSSSYMSTYLSKDTLSHIDYSVPSRYTRVNKSHLVGSANNVSVVSESEDSMAESDGSDVIKDLQNLSVQIRSHRGVRR